MRSDCPMHYAISLARPTRPVAPITPSPQFAGARHGQASEKPFTALGFAAVLSALLGLTGLGTMAYSTSLHQAKPHAIEAQLAAQDKASGSRGTRSALFDMASGGLKNMLGRFITGNIASDKTKAVQAFKTARNLQITDEESANDTLRIVSSHTGSPNASQTLEATLAQTKAGRAAYYDLLQDTVEFAHKNPTSWVGQALHSWEGKRLAQAEATLSQSDQHLINDLVNRYTGPSEQSPTDRALAFYQEYVDTIIAKHAPQAVDTCKAAGNNLFQEIQADRTAITNEATHRHSLLMRGLGMTGVGLLGLILSLGIMEAQKTTRQTFN